MKLLYLYIRKYNDIFCNVEFNFSSKYNVSLQNKHLSVEINEKAINNFYGDNIDEIVLILGKNGVGKTSILDLLGMKREDRSWDTYIHKPNGETEIKASYFILYDLDGDYYGFEFVDGTFIQGEGKIKNINMRNVKAENALYKTPMGVVMKKQG